MNARQSLAAMLEQPKTKYTPTEAEAATLEAVVTNLPAGAVLKVIVEMSGQQWTYVFLLAGEGEAERVYATAKHWFPMTRTQFATWLTGDRKVITITPLEAGNPLYERTEN